MIVKCTERYMVLSASFHAQKKRLLFYDGGDLVFDLVVALDNAEPDYLFPVDMARFIGKTLRIECEPQAQPFIFWTDEPQFDYSGKYRPYVHFTARRGWNNDPNGLVYTDGKYLMYFQHNPAATTWQNMHWGMAWSEDLMHWHEEGDVLFPDKNGTIFSGSGIVDEDNLTGLRQGGRNTLLFFYTAAGDTSRTSEGVPTTQRLAWSNDGGMTMNLFKKPLIHEMAPLNRDPKVIRWQDGSYRLVMFIQDHEFALFRSDDLIHWQELQRISLPDDAECPDFYPLPLDGDEEQQKWVFSAASDRYMIGSFDGDRFTPETPQLRLNYGNDSYAAQSWSNTPGRRIRTAFNKIVVPGMPFGGCMDVPQEMSLRTVNGSMKLCAWPVQEIKSLYADTAAASSIQVTGDKPFRHTVHSRACDVTLTVRASAPWQLDLFGLSIKYDPAAKLLTCGESTAPVEGDGGAVTLRVIYDTVVTQIFADQGSVYMGMGQIQDAMLNCLTVSSTDAEIVSFTAADLKPFYEEADEEN